ncbi:MULTISPECIES: hypothetical protein [Oxalobacteraceae]|jgi:hypothetical protein|nr:MULTISPECIES: hypothetical protein [Oxalobacteraceae]
MSDGTNLPNAARVPVAVQLGVFNAPLRLGWKDLVDAQLLSLR